MDAMDHYWDYFLVLEDDLFKASRYVEFSEGHGNVYSIEFAHSLFAAASEVDSILKVVCDHLDSDLEHDSIGDYKRTILKKEPRFCDSTVRVRRIHMNFEPWKEWQEPENQSPSWWKAYNKVKHHRTFCFQQATLNNALNAVSGLLCSLDLYFRYNLKRDILGCYPSPRYLEIATA